MTEEKKLILDGDIKLFADELKLCFSKDEIEEIARETDYVKRKGKIKACEFVCLCHFMNVEVANNTLVTLYTKLSKKTGILVIPLTIKNDWLISCWRFKCSFHIAHR